MHLVPCVEKFSHLTGECMLKLENYTDDTIGGISRRAFLKSATGAMGSIALASSTLSAGSLTNNSNAKRPNFLFILGEGVRYDELHATGNTIIQTPHLDRLVHEGMTFKNAFVTNALCLPSRATIMTGLYSHVTGAIDNRNRPIPPQFPILPDLLHESGYEVAFIGKSHVQGALKNHYWDYYFGFNGQADYLHPILTEGVKGSYGEAQRCDGYVDDLLTDKAVAWVNQKHEKPFCLFLWFYAPHAPFYRPRSILNMFNGVPIPVPSTFDADLKGYPPIPRPVLEAANKIGTTELGDNDPRTLEEVVKDHYAGVVSNDIDLGRVMDAMEKQGTLDDTAIIFSSDHGFFLGEWRLYDKRFMYEPSIRVPLTVWYPKLVRPGSSTGKMALDLDIAPTILELAGVGIPTQMQGKSLVPFLRGKDPANWRHAWLYEYYEYPEAGHVLPHRGIRTDRYKLIHFYLPPEEFELYDLQNDPHELRNLYPDPQYASLAKQLRAQLEELRKETGDTGKYDVNQAYIDASPSNKLRVHSSRIAQP